MHILIAIILCKLSLTSIWWDNDSYPDSSSWKSILGFIIVLSFFEELRESFKWLLCFLGLFLKIELLLNFFCLIIGSKVFFFHNKDLSNCRVLEFLILPLLLLLLLLLKGFDMSFFWIFSKWILERFLWTNEFLESFFVDNSAFICPVCLLSSWLKSSTGKFSSFISLNVSFCWISFDFFLLLVILILFCSFFSWLTIFIAIFILLFSLFPLLLFSPSSW